MTVLLSPVGGVASQFFDNSGNVLTGGKIYTYAAGTTTPQATYTTVSGNTAHPNPIILDAAGRVPGGEVWLTAGVTYKFVLRTSTDVLIGTYDNIKGISFATDASQITYTPAGAGAVTTTVQAKLRQIVSVFDFMTAAEIADVQAGTLSLDVTTAISNAIASISGTYGSTPAGGTLYFPTGAYSISSIYLDINNQCLILQGEASNYSSNVNRGTRLVARNATNNYLIQIYRTTDIHINDMTLDLNNLKTKGIDLTHAAGTGSILDYCQYNNLEFYNVKAGGSFVESEGNSILLGGEAAVHKFNNCVFQLNGIGGSYIGRSVHISNFNAWDWTFTSCYFAGGSQTASMWLEAGAVTLYSCVFENNDASSYDILTTGTAWLREYAGESHSQQPHLYIQALVNEGNEWSRSTNVVEDFLHFSNTATAPTVTIVDDSNSPIKLSSIKGYGVQINYTGTYNGFVYKDIDITNTRQVAIGVGAPRFDITTFKSQASFGDVATVGYLEKLYDKTLTYAKTQQFDLPTKSFVTVGPQTIGGVQAIAGADFITNGAFTTATTGWTAGNSATLTVVAGGVSGNALQVSGAAYGYASQAVVTGTGRKYRLSAYYKNGTTTGLLRVSSAAGGAGDIVDKAVTSATFALASATFTAIGTTTYIDLMENASGTMLWDSVTLTELPLVVVTDFAVTGLPVYANNAAALAGNLVVGMFYRTGADPDPVCVVH
jgi:hypothetical protein